MAGLAELGGELFGLAHVSRGEDDVVALLGELVSAYSLEASIIRQRRAHNDDEWVVSKDEMISRITALPAEVFPTPGGTPPNSPRARATTASTSPST